MSRLVEFQFSNECTYICRGVYYIKYFRRGAGSVTHISFHRDFFDFEFELEF